MRKQSGCWPIDFVILEDKCKQGHLSFALRHVTGPLSFEYVSSVRSGQCHLRAGCSQRYLGPRPGLPGYPAMAVFRGPGFRVFRSVGPSVGYQKNGRGGYVA